VKTRLMQANSSLADEQYDAAKEIFESILKDNDQNNGEAFYGLGLVSIMKKPPEINLAKEFFQKAVQAASCPNGSKVWAYIYLGRIFDMEKNREEALRQYQAAIALGDDTRNAQAVAQKGLSESFGPH
jgi:tetratricopeptide (TPR) repeat protein